MTGRNMGKIELEKIDFCQIARFFTSSYRYIVPFLPLPPKTTTFFLGEDGYGQFLPNHFSAVSPTNQPTKQPTTQPQRPNDKKCGITKSKERIFKWHIMWSTFHPGRPCTWRSFFFKRPPWGWKWQGRFQQRVGWWWWWWWWWSLLLSLLSSLSLLLWWRWWWSLLWFMIVFIIMMTRNISIKRNSRLLVLFGSLSALQLCAWDIGCRTHRQHEALQCHPAVPGPSWMDLKPLSLQRWAPITSHKVAAHNLCLWGGEQWNPVKPHIFSFRPFIIGAPISTPSVTIGSGGPPVGGAKKSWEARPTKGSHDSGESLCELLGGIRPHITQSIVVIPKLRW